MGEVWLGRHVVSGSLGAVKRLTPQHARRDALTRFFTREGRAIARLSHPHVVPLFEYGDDYLVTGFVAGSNLGRRMQTPIDPTSALRVTPRSPPRWRMRTSAAWCTATSSRPTSCSTRPAPPT